MTRKVISARHADQPGTPCSPIHPLGDYHSRVDRSSGLSGQVDAIEHGIGVTPIDSSVYGVRRMHGMKEKLNQGLGRILPTLVDTVGSAS